MKLPALGGRSIGRPKVLFASMGGVIALLLLVIVWLAWRSPSAPEPSEANDQAELVAATEDEAPSPKLDDGKPAVEAHAATELLPSPASPPITPPPPVELTSAGAAGSTQQPSDAAPSLRYGWKVGESYAYELSADLEQDGEEAHIDGTVLYHVRPGLELAELAPKEAVGSGSGVVVNSNGYLLTCDHVVAGATEIEVVVDGRTHPGEVVLRDSANDLAVVRIPATDLPVLPLASSTSLALAEDVRAVGYPLSGILGQSVKITRGTVAGFVGETGGRLIQVDVPINPGNSGGPLILENGALVGVITAKLANHQISNVGFAVPSSTVQNLLEKGQIPYLQAADTKRFSGPELARRVTPAVAFLRVTCTPEGAGHGDRLVLQQKAFGRISRQGTSSQGEPRLTQRICLVDQFGARLFERGNSLISAALGPVGEFPVIPLPHDGAERWSLERKLAVRPFGYKAQYPATQVTEYHVKESSEEEVVVGVRHVLKALHRAGADPLMQFTGQGEVTIDRARGIPLQAEFSATLMIVDAGKTDYVPISANWALTDPDAARELIAERSEDAKAQMAKLKTARTVEAAVIALRSLNNRYQRDEILALLARMKPVDSKRSLVTEALRPLLAEDEYGLNDDLNRAACVWGLEEDLLNLLSKWRNVDTYTRQAVIKRLAELKSSRAGRMWALAIGEKYRIELTDLEVLRQLGPAAESGTITLLGHRQPDVRMAACAILAEIGNEKGLDAVMRLYRIDRTPNVRNSAKAAIRAIRQRMSESDQ